MATKNVENAIIDVDLSGARKKRFRIDGDDSRILELNTSDLNILPRLRETYPKLVETANTAFSKLPEIDNKAEDYDFVSDEPTTQLIDALTSADSAMREMVDYIFDSNVCEVCAPSGSMYDPVGGQFRFEQIINALAPLYEQDISSGMKQISQRVKKHTSKYTR